MSELWIIEPRDPLIVRDGRPFGPNPGARARTLPFPFPSTIAGGVRALAGADENGRFDMKNIAAVKDIKVKGPLLVACDSQRETPFLVPAPRDMLMLKPEDASKANSHVNLVPLVPVDEAGLESNLPNPLQYTVGLELINLQKPAKNVPTFWYWDQFERWLTHFAPEPDERKKSAYGLGGLATDRRTHVGIKAETLAANEGDLFATSGLEFTAVAKPDEDDKDRSLTDAHRLGLAVDVTLQEGLSLTEGIASLGGEQRMVQWRDSTDTLPSPPSSLYNDIAADEACRLFLLTPAFFEKGWLPTKLLQTKDGVEPQLKAAVVGKPETVSGWDFEKKRPKPTRRLAPAGSVYFIKFEGGNADSIKAWLTDVWMECHSDDDEMSDAGFGLIAIGRWDGKARGVAVKEKQDA